MHKRIADLPVFELLDAPEGVDEDPREVKKRAADRDIYIALKHSVAEAEDELANACKWLSHAQQMEEQTSEGDEVSDGGAALLEEMEKLYVPVLARSWCRHFHGIYRSFGNAYVPMLSQVRISGCHFF